ncbi:hypothetical protein RKD42_004050 [Streptomyces ambofaciens]
MPKRHFVSITAGVWVGRTLERVMLSGTSSWRARACPQNSTRARLQTDLAQSRNDASVTAAS